MDRSFLVNANGDRVSKTVNGVKTDYYLSDDGDILAQVCGDNRLDFIYGADGVIGFKHNDKLYMYIKNILGDIVKIVDTDGMTVVEYVYDAWGNHKVLDEDGDIVGAGVPDRPNCDCATGECDCAVGAAFCRPHIGNLNPFRYRGYYHDTETGWYYLKTRYYDPQVRRFINGDNLNFLDPSTINGLNLYTYCSNNPINLVDPDGTTPKILAPLIAVLKKIGAKKAATKLASFAAKKFGAKGVLKLGSRMKGLIGKAVI